MITQTYLPYVTYDLCDSSDSSDSTGISDSCDSSDISDSSDSSDSSDQTTFFTNKLLENQQISPTNLKNKIVMKLKNSYCDETEIVMK